MLKKSRKIIKRRHLRALVRDYILDTIDEQPHASPREIHDITSKKISEDFSGSRWLDLLLRILEFLLPIIIILARNNEEE